MVKEQGKFTTFFKLTHIQIQDPVSRKFGADLDHRKIPLKYLTTSFKVGISLIF